MTTPKSLLKGEINCNKYNVMNKILLGFLILAFSCSTDKQKNSLTQEHLKGNVKSLRAASFYAVDKFGEITKGDKGGAGWLAPD